MTAEVSVTHQQSSCSPTGSHGGGGGGINSPRSSRQTLPSPWVKVVCGEPESVSTATSSATGEAAITDSAPALTGSGLSQGTGQALAAADEAPEVGSSDGGNVCGGLVKAVWNKPLNVLNVAADSSQCPGQTLAATDESQEVGSSDGANAGGLFIKAVWNKPLNVAADTSPVMGAESWPDLSEAARLPKSSTESSSKPVPDVLITPLQGPVISHNLQHKYAKPNANANNNNNHGHFTRQNSTKVRSSGTGRGGSAGFTRPPPPPTPPPLPPHFPMYEMPYLNSVSPVLDAPVRGEGPHHRPNSNWTPRPMGDHSPHRNSWRRGTFVGGRPRGDGPYANGYGGRHDQDRDWHGPRGSNGRDAHMPHQMVPPPPHAPRGFIRPPHPGAPPFIAPQPLRPFVNPMGYDMPSPYLYAPPLPPEAFRGAPIMPHAAPMFFPPPLRTLILNQIEYYFSETNLEKDAYLRSNMDDEAWVPVSLIANFRRVQSLTNDIQLILDSLRNSTVVEVQGNKLRPLTNWQRWARCGESSSSATRSGESYLPSTSLQNLAIDDVMAMENGPSSSGQVPSSSETGGSNLNVDADDL